MKTSRDVGFGSWCAVRKVPKTGLIFWQGNFRRGAQIKDHQAQPQLRAAQVKAAAAQVKAAAAQESCRQ
jgi:hypothetical protein